MRQQHRLYRDAQNDYWQARSRRAHRILAARKAARTALAVLTVVVVLGAGAVLFSGKGGEVILRAEDLAGISHAPAIEPEQEVESSIDHAAGASVYNVSANAVTAMYQPGDGGSYMAICIDPENTKDDVSGVVSELTSAAGTACSSTT